MEVRDDRRYTEEHEWALVEDGRVRIGITDYAQDALGDVVYVELPEVGASFEAGAGMAEVESTKSVAEVYAPLAGTVAETNAALADSPELVNAEPYDGGWFVVLSVEDASAVDAMLSATAYAELTS